MANMPIFLVLGGQRLEEPEFKVITGYTVSSRQALATRHIVSKFKTNKNSTEPVIGTALEKRKVWEKLLLTQAFLERSGEKLHRKRFSS